MCGTQGKAQKENSLHILNFFSIFKSSRKRQKVMPIPYLKHARTVQKEQIDSGFSPFV